MKHTVRSLVSAFALLVCAASLQAQVFATWLGGTSDWHDPANWDSNPDFDSGFPNASGDIAYFGNAGNTSVTIGNATSVGSLQFNPDAQAYTLTITSSGSFSVNFEIYNPSAWTQSFVIDAGGTMALNFGAAFSNSSVSNSGTLDLAGGGSAGDATIHTLSGGVVNVYGGGGNAPQFITDAGGTVNFGTSDGDTVYAGSIEGAGTYNLGGKYLALGSDSDYSVSGSINGGGILMKNGTGTLTLSNSVDSAGLYLSAYHGTTVLDSASSSSVHAVYGVFDIGEGATVRLAGTGGDQISNDGGVNGFYGTLDMNGRSETINDFTGAESSRVTNSAAATTSTLTVGANNATNGSLGFDGKIEDGAGTVALTKIGTGTLRLTNGDSSYSGGTLINAGAVAALGGYGGDPGHSSLGSGPITVASGATLAGHDKIQGLVTINSGGHLTSGDLADYGGVLRFDGGLTLNGGAAIDLKLSNGTLFYLTMGDGAVLTGPSSGTVTVNFYDFGDFSTPGLYTVIDFGAPGATTSDFDLSDFAIGSTFAGYNFALQMGATSLDVLVTSVPEPSTYALLFGAGALGVAALRRRQRQVAVRVAL
jgi:autotransporter-associated beta strand protein